MNQSIKRLGSIMLFLGLMLIQTAVYGAVTVNPVSGTDPKLVGIVQKVVDSFNVIMKQKYQVTLTNDVQLYICPNIQSYIEVLETKFEMAKEDAERRGHLTAGMAHNGEGEKHVAINLDPDNNYDPEDNAYYVTAHELVHQIQYQLEEKSTSRKLYWMKEGTADVIAAEVVGSMGYESFLSWKTSQYSIDRSLKKFASPKEMGYIGINLWERLVEAKKYPYQIASLMVLYLQTKGSPKGNLDLIKYFRGGGNVEKDRANFEQCFGTSVATFEEGFQKWFKENLITLGKMNIKSKGNWAQGVGIDEGFYRSQIFFKQNFKEIIESSQEIIFYPDRFSYQINLKKELKIKNQAEIEKMVKENPWWIRGNDTWINLNAMKQCSDQVFNTAVMMVTRLQKQQKSEAIFEDIFWFKQGIKYALAAMITEKAEVGTVDGYRQQWIKTVEPKSMALSLRELQTQEGWNRAVDQFGFERVNSFAGLAVLQLIREKGLASFNAWFGNPEKLVTGQELFKKTFEIDPDTFSVNFKI